MRASIHDDVALPSLPLARVVKHRDAARRLNNPGVTAHHRPKVRQDGGHTPVPQASVLDIDVAIQSSHVVARRELLPPWRRLGVVLPAGARRSVLLLAGFSGLHESELKFPIGGSKLLSF